jgi:hypothetical protein
MGTPDALCPGHAIQALQTAKSASVVFVGYFQSWGLAHRLILQKSEATA